MSKVGTLQKLLLVFITVLSFSATANAACYGRVPNPVTDVCWECMFPLTIGTNSLGTSSDFPDVKTSASSLCGCSSGANVTVGTNIGFWEPIRTIEIVREPFCFPSLGGAKIGSHNFAPAHGRTPNPKQRSHRVSFYQIHWYYTPWLYLLEILFDTNCLEQSPWDMAYMTELDPLWDDSQATYLLNPDVALFSNPVALGACAADCLAATFSTPSDTLYWCAGCAGSIFPLTGWVNAHITPMQAWSLLTQRFTLKLHREGVQWAHYGKDGQCGPRLEFIMAKSMYRTQMQYPTRETQGKCCKPFGASTALDAMGKTPPIYGEDGAFLVWRRKDCCQGMNLADAAAGGLQ